MTFLSAAIVVPIVVLFLGTAMSEVSSALTEPPAPEVAQVVE